MSDDPLPEPETQGSSGEDTDADGRFPRGTAAGKKLGNFLALFLIWPGHFFKVAGRQTVVATTRVAPFVGSSFWRGMVKWSVEQYQKATGADVVNFSFEPNGLEPRAANWVESDPNKPEQKPGWKEAGGDKTWGPGADGRNAVERMGKADVIFSDRQAHEISSSLQSRWAEALDLQQARPLVAGATVEQPIIEVYPKNPAEMEGGEGQAVADGGMVERQVGQTTVHAENAYLDDALVDLAGNHGDGKGMVFSARKYRDQKLSQADAEEIDKAEVRGEIAGKQGADSAKIYRMARLCILAIVAILFAIFGLPILFGGGGGTALPF